MDSQNSDAVNNADVASQGKVSPSFPQSMPPNLILELRPQDVLLGRGHKIINYEGNKAFREIVKARKEEYVSACRHQVKDDIAREIYNEIIKKNGRFLRRVATADEAKRLGVPKNVTAWIVVEEAVALEKTKQTLRDKESSSRAHAELEEEEIDGKMEIATLPLRLNHYANTANHQVSSLDNAHAATSDINLSLHQLLLQNYRERILSGNLLHGEGVVGSSSSLANRERLNLLQSQRQLAAFQQQQQQISRGTISTLLGGKLSKNSYAGHQLHDIFAQLDSRSSDTFARRSPSETREQQLASKESMLQNLGGQNVSNIQQLLALQRSSLLTKFSGNISSVSDLLARSQRLQGNPINTLQMNSAPVSGLESSDIASLLRLSSTSVGNRPLWDLRSSIAQFKNSFVAEAESDNTSDRKRPAKAAKDLGEKADFSQQVAKKQR